MKPNEFVDKIYCINLDRRPDRWKRCQEIFAKHNLEVERVSAVDGRTLGKTDLPPGALGVLRTALGIIKQAKEHGYRNILIFEDDIELEDDFSAKFAEYIPQVPDDWQLIYLGGNNRRESPQASKNVKRVVRVYGAYAVIIRDRIYDRLIRKLSKEQEQLDFSYARMQMRVPTYIVSPYLAWVRDDFSDINNRFIRVSYLKEENAN